MRLLTFASIVAVLLALAATAAAQSTTPSEPRVAPSVLQAPSAPSRGREVDAPLAVIGAATFVVGWLGGGGTNLALSHLTYLRSARSPCIPDFCGGSVYTVSFIPAVGSAIWSVMVLDTPPPAGAGIAATGFIATIAQHVGLGILIAGLVGRVPPILPMGFVTNDGATFGLGGSF